MAVRARDNVHGDTHTARIRFRVSTTCRLLAAERRWSWCWCCSVDCPLLLPLARCRSTTLSEWKMGMMRPTVRKMSANANSINVTTASSNDLERRNVVAAAAAERAAGRALVECVVTGSSWWSACSIGVWSSSSSPLISNDAGLVSVRTQLMTHHRPVHQIIVGLMVHSHAHTLGWDGLRCERLHWNTLSYQRRPYPIPCQRCVCVCVCVCVNAPL